MTFSDAEEDQPSRVHNGITVPNGIDNASETSGESVSGAVGEELGESINSSKSSNEQEATPKSTMPSESLHSGSSNGNADSSISSSSSSSATTASVSNQENGAVGSSNYLNVTHETESINSIEGNANASHTESPSAENNSNNPKGLEIEKIREKLHQIHGYIEQTTSAMQALEIEGDLNKITQYNTLVKCLRELKKSESKLTSHLSKLENSSGSVPDNGQLSTDNTNSQAETQGSGVSGSESMGVVDTVNEPGGRLSMRERLSRHENEQQQLSDRLRESLVRREELMARYQATRERLNNLKRERMGIVQEERRLLQNLGAPETPYENPVTNADTWTVDQLEKAIDDFQGLKDKVDRLYIAYTDKLEATPSSNAETRTELQRKIDQIVVKKNQITTVLQQMNQLLVEKREEQRNETDSENVEISSENTTTGAVPPEGPAAASGARRNPSEDELEGGEAAAAVATGSDAEASDIAAKQRHLQSLKDQLHAMKALLTMSQGSPDPEERSASGAGGGVEASTAGGEEVLVESTIVGVNGEVIHLSESERRNPEVVSKYRQLSEAKQRLAKMEEVMRKIAEARQTGRALGDVLSPENMAILNDAREEEALALQGPSEGGADESPIRASQSQWRDDASQAAADAVADAPRRIARLAIRETTPPFTPRRNECASVSRSQSKSVVGSTGAPDWGGDSEISAMQFHLKKKTPGIPAVNEGYKMGREKGAIKKQARELVNENGAAAADPRLVEVLALQEELKEKKNALEALMRRMGKASSVALDNISDNVSDLHSEGTPASWSDEDDDDVEEEGARAARPPHPFGSNSKNRDPTTRPARPDNTRFSINDLRGCAAPSKGTRPKHNRYPRANAAPVPVATWENVPNAANVSASQNPNSTKVQNTVTAALSQLNHLQETINSLYGDLRVVEMASRQQEPPPPFAPFTPAVPLASPPIFNPLQQNLMPSYYLQPLSTTQGRGDLGASSHILAGLQQCFSQLYLHSLEIQSLSKHLQVRPSYPFSSYPFYPQPNYFQPQQPPPSL